MKTEQRKKLWKNFVRENYTYFNIDGIDSNDFILWTGNDTDNFLDVNYKNEMYTISIDDMERLIDEYNELDSETAEKIYNSEVKNYLYKNLKYTKAV